MLTRREALRLASSTLGGLVAGAMLGPRLALAAEARAKRCIWIWLNGGPSHIDTFDPKPGTKVGGPFKAIATRTPGMQICEHLPRLAEASNMYTLLRNMSTREGNHQRARYLMHTGYIPNATVVHPSLGGWVSRELGQATDTLPAFVSIGGQGAPAGFFGVQYGPFAVRDPSKRPDNTGFAPGIDGKRFDERLALLGGMEDHFSAETHLGRIVERRSVFAHAVALMRAPKLDAFSIEAEPQALKAAYGDSDFGRGCLLARRLVEVGVRFVEITLDGWDTHQDGFTRSKALMSTLDAGLGTLLKDLADRKLLDSTLLVMLGDFGRTPAINAQDGRDHYPQASSVVVAGGGIRNGLLVGETDAEGGKVAAPVSVPDLFATFVTLLGINPQQARTTPLGRPVAITDYGQPIASIISG